MLDVRFRRFSSMAAACLLALAAPAADWFDANVGDYTAWPTNPDVPQGGVWATSSADVSLGDLATLSGEAPRVALEIETGDAALDFQAAELDLDEATESVTVSLSLESDAFESSRLPAVDPDAKAGAILVKDAAGARLYYLSKESGANANVWSESSFVVADTSIAQDMTVTLKKTDGSVLATYKVGETVVASEVEVAAETPKVSAVRFGGSGRLFALSGIAEMRSTTLTVGASLASDAHLEVVGVRNLDSGLAIEPVAGKYSVPSGARVAITFRPVKGYRLVGDGVLELTATSAAIVLDASTPSLVPAEEANTFRVTPYVQHPKPDAMTVMWLANEDGAATFEYWKVGDANVTKLTATRRDELSSNEAGTRFANLNALEYCQAGELGYDRSPDAADNASGRTAPFQYRVRVTGLEPDTAYGYRVTLDGQGATYANTFRTSPDPAKWHGFKFIYYSDSETEPADNDPRSGRTSDWTDPKTGAGRRYLASQTEAYASNICAAVDFGTDLIVMAGDLAQTGSRQNDWDEFWRHNAGQLNDPAGRIPLLAAPGNHDYSSYTDGGQCGITKFMSYLEMEPNGTTLDADQQERFHRVDYGPVAFIFLDGNKGDQSDPMRDTTRQMTRENGCRAPDFNEDTEQYRWLEAQLADAQKTCAFTFVVSHQCPFSVGYHGRENHYVTYGHEEKWSGRALRVLLPLLHKYGVDGWFAGHDEMMERSVHEGEETLTNGMVQAHSFSVWDMGIAGDGLRGTAMTNNEYEVYRADVNCPEVYENNVLIEGGKHYGHLQVTIDQTEDGSWRATFDPIYVFFNNDANGNAVYGGVRHYADKVVRVSSRCKGAPPAQGVTKTSVDVSTYVPTKMPQGLVTTFWDGPLTRGFTWQTDTSVTETKLWLLKGEYDQDDGNTFVDEGAYFAGDCIAKDEPDMNCHRLHVTGLESGATYSYRYGGNGYYAYGRFTANDKPAALTAVYFGDTQSKDAAQLYKAENTVATAVRTAGGIANVDLAIAGGDIFDVAALANANHVSYGASVPADYKCWKWSLMADLIGTWLPDVPWIAVPGNHDYDYYDTVMAVDYVKEGMTGFGNGCSSADLGNVHFVQLPFFGKWLAAGAPAAYSNAVKWLKADLAAASSVKWKVVCMHWGLNTTGDHGVKVKQDGVVDYVKLFAPVFSSGHVDLVLQAHDHTFSKTIPYRWDTAGYTSSRNDGTVLNLSPVTKTVGGETYDLNPNGTYYVATGASGHRVGEEKDGYSLDTGDNSYTHRDPVIAIGTTAVASSYKDLGAYASGDFNKQMFGVLQIGDETLDYDFYVAEEDGSATLVDKVRIRKSQMEEQEPGFLLMLK